MEYPVFRVEMGRLALVYGEQPPERLLEYWEALKGLRGEPFQRACAAYKRTPGVMRFPFPNELVALTQEAAAGTGARSRAIGPGEHDAAKRFAEADAARRERTRPPDPALLAHWNAKFADLLTRREATERAARGEPPLPSPPPVPPPFAGILSAMPPPAPNGAGETGAPAAPPIVPPPTPAFARPARPVRPARPPRPTGPAEPDAAPA